MWIEKRGQESVELGLLRWADAVVVCSSGIKTVQCELETHDLAFGVRQLLEETIVVMVSLSGQWCIEAAIHTAEGGLD